MAEVSETSAVVTAADVLGVSTVETGSVFGISTTCVASVMGVAVVLLCWEDTLTDVCNGSVCTDAAAGRLADRLLSIVISQGILLVSVGYPVV